MRTRYKILAFIILLPFFMKAQEVDISNTNAVSTAELNVVSPNNNTGVLVPCMTSAQRDAIAISVAHPANGLLIYDTDLNKFMYNAGTGGTILWTFVGEIPKIASTATITGPLKGDMRYQTSDNSVYFYNGTIWTKISAVVGP